MKRKKTMPEMTPRAQVRHALRLLWMRSRERQATLKRDQRTCQCCGRKASVARGKEFKVEVHHKTGITDWEGLVNYVYRQLLVGPEHLETLCRECHEKETKEAKL